MDLTPSGKPKLGYSYPSGQRRQGPAPLASFEDLPSDEQISPEADGDDDNTLQDLSPGPEEFDHILSFDSRDVLTQPSPHKLVGPRGVNGNNEGFQISTNGVSVMQSTIAINSDNALLSPTSGPGWSSKTVNDLSIHHTSGEEQSSASGEVTPTGYSSPLVPYGYELSSSRCRDNLTVPSDESGGEKSPSPDSRRKGSWTDIFFRGRSRSRSKSPIGSECSQKSPGFEQETVPVEKAKNKKGFFSFLKVGRKSSTSSGTVNGPSQAQSSSSSTANQANNSASVSTPSQENESISFNERNGKNANNYASNYTSLNESNNKSKENWTNMSTTKSSKSEKCDYAPSQAMVSGENAELGKLRDELTVIQDLNEPKESQQDIINIIEREIEQKMSAFNEDIQLDLPPDLQFDELLISSKANILSTNQQSELESSSNIALDDPTNNNNPLPQPNLTRKLITRTDTIDDECQSLPRSFKTKDLDSSLNRTTETVVATIEHNSSEKGYSSGSDLEESSATLNAESGKKASYLKRQSSETSEIDFEAATLLTHDSIDYEDYDGPTEIILSPDTEDKINHENRASSRRRLDVNTIPIDRPRSATPINIAPLEAFLNTASPSPDPNVEKIRLSLPGDTFTNCTRAKSPRKSNPAIWLEFCEKGLHSPKSFTRRRRSTLDKDISPRDSLPSGGLGIKNQTNDAFTPVTETASQAVSPLTPITPLDFEDQWTPFGDNFNPYAFIKENLEHQVERYKWSMECDKCDCLIGKLGNINSNDPSGCNTPAEGQMTPLSPRELGEPGDEQPLVSPIACSCDCHHNISIIRSNSNQVKQEGLYSISSDISSASSRLIQASSASSSKSSSIGEVEDKVLS
ncbi:uncharacterized protein LOC107364802 [Tetranychus urticae]|uniref:uncharacterized protein LOC107364802 n=1 Tax=Tetranychus urticae TaxID=32264 RepID=UPI00077BE301|nr:uncharacterized protein LOC107364802 [Tetranychus urticae]